MTQPLSERSEGGLSAFERVLSQQVTAMEMSEAQLRSLSPLALAYIGDAVYELFIRSQLLLPPKSARTFHRQVVEQVRAEQQAHYLEYLQPYLTAAEADILRRGRNAASSRRPRASLADYQKATALEALIGYLYLTDPQRLMEVLHHLPLGVDPVPTSLL